MENELSIKISATAEKALKSIDKLIPKINKTENCVSKMLLQFDRKGQISGFTAELKDLDSEMNKVTKGSKNLKNALNLGATFAIASKVFRSGLDWMGKSNEYSEALNLFNVVLDKSTKKGIRFQNVMNEAFGTNQAETLTRQGLYQSMAENMGIAQEYAYIMSETSTKLVNDISSLYNKNENVVAEALRAGVYAGQTKPLRSFGMDITEKSLQPILDEIGLKNSDGSARTVRDLSQAEKQIVRYLSVLKQSSEAHGDWANTIESPSNQLKIFNNQLVEAQRAFANLFIGTFGQILPYANAILMVIKEVSNAIATMFGIEISDYNTGIADMSDTFVDVEDNIGGATGALKELKRETLGFDQINNINEDKGSSGGSGSSINGGIDKKLLDAIKSYDNGMDSVRMKALDIRDRIMEWLGFTKEIDPLTGKVSFRFADTNSTLCKIVVALKNIIVNGGKAIAGVFNVLKKDFDNGIFGKAIVFALESVNNVLSFIGKNKTAQKVIARILELLMGIKTLKLIPGGNQLLSLIGTLSKKTSSFGTILSNLIGHIRVYTNLAGKDGLTATNKLTAGIVEGTKAWQQNLSTIDKWKVALTGIATGVAGLTGIAMAMEDISTSGFNMANSLGLVASGLGTVTSFAMTGTAILPGWGTAIGACVGVLASLTTALSGYKSESQMALESAKKRREEAEKYVESVKQEKQAIEDSVSNAIAITTYHEQLLAELQNIVDANGKVKDGYQDRANFILTELNKAYGIEYSLVDGQIQNYNLLIDSIKGVIETKKAEILLNANEKAYSDAIQQRATAWKNANDAYKIYEKSQEEANKKEEEIANLRKQRDEAMARGGYVNAEIAHKLALEIGIQEANLKQLTETANKNKDTYDLLNSTYKGYCEDIINYENLSTDVITGNAEKIEESVKNYSEVIQTENGKVNMSEAEKLAFYKQNGDKIIEHLRSQGEEITDEMRNQAYSQYNILVENLVNQTKTVEDLTPENVQRWATLGSQDADAFKNAISKLPEDVKYSLYNKMILSGSELGKVFGDSLSNNMKVNSATLNSTWNHSIQEIQKKISQLGGIAGGSVLGVAANLRINGYTNGGFPEDGFFFANHNELVGKFSNGRTAVANNGQIIEGIKAGVYEAVSMALVSNMSSTNVDINVHADEGIIVEKAVNGIQQHVNQTGELPFTVPV